MTFPQRFVAALRLDPALYEEVEADQHAGGQAVGVVLLSSLAVGVGAIPDTGSSSLVVAAAGALLGWALWALVTWLVGTKLLPQAQTSADVGQLLRTIGFAQAPGVFRLLAIVPVIGPVISVVVALWLLAAMVIAVRQALDYTSTLRAVIVCLLGWVAYLIVLIVVLPLMLYGSR